MTATEGSARIRRMTADDVDALVAIARDLKDAPQWPRSGYETALMPEVWPQRIALAAETAGSNIAGFLVAALIPPEAELESIAVAAEFQRRGLARELFAALVWELRARSVTRVLLEVRPSNQAARAFYLSLGFVETARRPGYYADPVEDAILLRLELAENGS